jgi:L-alanine-DL-glutamate epimerase-like enolase superfamily enzyme
MKIKNAKIYPLSIPLIEPIKMSREIVADAKTVLLCLTDEQGRQGWGEASVAPLMTGETLDSLVGSIKYLVENSLEVDWGNPDRFAEIFNLILYSNASAKSCLEMALLDLYTQDASMPLWKFLGANGGLSVDTSPSPIPILRMLGGSMDKELSDAKALRELGFRHWKIKIGSLPLEQDLHRVKILCDFLVGDTVSVDANCALNLTDAIHFCESTQAARLTFAEQLISADLPISDFVTLKKQSPIPIGLDESIHGMKELEDFIAADAFNGASLKLIKTGGLIPALECAKLLKRNALELNLACKVAETSLSVAATASLGFAVGKVSWGFSMSNQYLQMDICDQPLVAVDGQIDPSQLANSGVGITPNVRRVMEVMAKGYSLIQC